MPKPTAKPLHIFRAGKHTSAAGDSLEFSAADVATTAAIYDPAVSRAPIVVGHPKVDDPAYGWADRVIAENGELYAEPAEVDPQFADMVNAGRFKNISVALYPPNHPQNPKPGAGYYLRHIGFLGATPPAVKGLKQAQFNGQGDGIVSFEFSAADDGADSLLQKFMSLFTKALAGTGLRVPSFANKEDSTVPDTKTPTQAELDQRAADLARRETEFAERETKAKKDAAAVALTAARTSATEFAEKLAKDGKILPTDKPAVIESLTALHGAGEVEFGEGDTKVKQTPAAALRTLLDSRKPVVDFQRKTPEGTQAAGTEVSFAAPSGFTVEPEKAALHAQVLAYSTEKKVDYATALTAVNQQIAAAKAAAGK